MDIARQAKLLHPAARLFDEVRHVTCREVSQDFGAHIRPLILLPVHVEAGILAELVDDGLVSIVLVTGIPIDGERFAASEDVAGKGGFRLGTYGQRRPGSGREFEEITAVEFLSHVKYSLSNLTCAELLLGRRTNIWLIPNSFLWAIRQIP